MREIVYYRTASGRNPVKEFLDGLDPKKADKITWVLGAVAILDPVPATYLKKLSGTKDLWEIRAQHGGSMFRLLCFFEGRRVIVLLSAFSKKSEQVPALEIKVAEQRMREFLKREESRG
jgi:phage-related protein